MITVTVPVSHLKALRLHAAEKDVRYYLQGIYFDLPNGKLAATDGHRMMLVGTKTGAGDFIAPNEFIDNIIKACKGRNAPESVEITFDSGTLSCEVLGATFKAVPVDGKFPDYQRVIPSSLSGEVSFINSEYLYDAAKALALIDGAKKQYAPYIAYNGNGPAIAYGGSDEALVILMPMRSDRTNVNESMLAWAKGKYSVAQAA